MLTSFYALLYLQLDERDIASSLETYILQTFISKGMLPLLSCQWGSDTLKEGLIKRPCWSDEWDVAEESVAECH